MSDTTNTDKSDEFDSIREIMNAIEHPDSTSNQSVVPHRDDESKQAETPASTSFSANDTSSSFIDENARVLDDDKSTHDDKNNRAFDDDDENELDDDNHRENHRDWLPPTEQTDEEKAEDRRLRAESFRIMASVGNFGIFLIIALVFGYFIGNGMDKFFHTRPVFTIFWIVCAVAASIQELVKNILKAKKLAESPSNKETSTDKDSQENV